MTMSRAFHVPFGEMKTDVFEQVAILTAYHAAKNDRQEEWCDRIPMITEDRSMFDLFWQNSVAKATRVLDINAARRRPRHMAPVHVSVVLLQSLVRIFLINDITAQWFSVTLPEAENKYSSSAEAALGQCRKLLQLSHARKHLDPL